LAEKGQIDKKAQQRTINLEDDYKLQRKYQGNEYNNNQIMRRKRNLIHKNKNRKSN